MFVLKTPKLFFDDIIYKQSIFSLMKYFYIFNSYKSIFVHIY